jgi:hypothetical protein
MPISVGKPGTKYVRMEINIWYQPDDDSIHITSDDDPKFHSTVKNDSASVRGHGSLFKHFQRVLMDQGRWPGGTD